MKTNATDQPVNRKLQAYLETNVTGFKGPARMWKFPGGQSNPTYKLTTASGEYVLRRQPPGKLLKSAHAVDREFRVLNALRDSKVPVARAYHLCEDREVLDSMFYIMDFCDGRIFWKAALPELDSNAERAAIYNEMNRVLAELHRVDINAAGLSDYGKPGNYFSRQLSRWTGQYRASEPKLIPAMEDLMTWLEENQPPADDKVALVHGDYRMDNFVFHHQRPEIIAVLDWELSTLGHPYADLAYQCMQLRLPTENDRPSGLAGLDRAALGIPGEAEYIDRYCKRMNINDIDHWTFYLSFSFFRLAAIIQGVAARALQGNASNAKAKALGERVEPVARTALDVINEHAT
jgi:aminoglycoside phosphotransferase (APT) family kinase protein